MIKSFVENLSSIRFLGMKNFVVIDMNEYSANIVLFRASNNPLNVFSTNKLPKSKILFQKECKIIGDSDFELNREIKILAENYPLKKAVLVFLINKYKYYNISLSKEGGNIDEESSTEDLLRKQIPPNFSNDDFILHYEKINEDESIDNFLITISRKQDIEKTLSGINIAIFQLKFAVPAIFILSKLKSETDKVNSFVDFQKDKLIHYNLSNECKITQDEYFIDPETEYQKSVTEILKEITSEVRPEGEKEHEKTLQLNFHGNVELTSPLDKAILSINANRKNRIIHEFSSSMKHNLAYRNLFCDNIFNYKIEKYFPSKDVFNVEKEVTTRLIVGVFSVMFFLLILLNGMNWITSNSLSEISTENKNKQKTELLVKEFGEQNEQLISDIKSLANFKYNGEKISCLLKIISTTSINNLSLTNLAIKKNSYDKYEVKLLGEAQSKEEVVTYLKNLENNSAISNIELIWMDKKRVDSDPPLQVNNDIFQFSVSMVFHENKNS